MKKTNQEDLFIESEILCQCSRTKHALTYAEYANTLSEAHRIKKLILDHGWDLQVNYFHYMDKTNGQCNAWNTENSPYLCLRANNQEEVEKATISLLRTR
jgi:hypothetical protein